MRLPYAGNTIVRPGWKGEQRRSNATESWGSPLLQLETVYDADD